MDDDISSLLEAMKSDIYKSDLLERLGEKVYKEKFDILTELKKKENKDGKFRATKDILDIRTAS